MAVASRPLRAARAWARVRRVLLDPRGSEPIAIPGRATRVAALAPHLRQGCSGGQHDVRLEGSSSCGKSALQRLVARPWSMGCGYSGLRAACVPL